MNEYEKLYSGIGKVAWGYFFIYFDLKINGISLLPAFIGYFLLLSAVRGLGEVERELKLLRIPGAILASWHLATWLCSLGPLNFVGALPIVDLLISIVNIYYQFQLLTNLASIASANQPAGSALDRQILGCRTLQTILLTVIILVRQVNLWLIESGSRGGVTQEQIVHRPDDEDGDESAKLPLHQRNGDGTAVNEANQFVCHQPKAVEIAQVSEVEEETGSVNP